MEGIDGDSTSRSSPFILERVASVIFLDQLRSKHISLMLPGIVSCGISLPLNEVLKVSSSSEVAMIDDGLDFEFFLSINDVWGRPRKVVSVLASLSERCQKPGVEDVMDGPGRR